MQRLVSDSLVKTVFNWVEGHLVEEKGLRNCSHPEITNDLVDGLADVKLQNTIQSQAVIESNFPFEKL